MEKIIKTITEPEIKEIDEKKRIIWHKISVEKKDRMNDIVRIDGIDTKNFKKKPTVLYGHMYSGLDPLPVIGQNIGFKKEGKKYYAGTKFLDPQKDDISPKLADLVNDLWTLNIKKLMGWSVGFIPVETADLKEGDKVVGLDFKKSELLEYSNVILPANQDAVNDMVEKGEVTKEFGEILKDPDNLASYHGAFNPEELPGETAVERVRKSEEEKNDLDEETETKPSKENHICRLNNGNYSRYRSEKRKHEGKEYTVRFGIRRDDGKAEEYEYFYPKAKWSASEAKAHCKDHKGKFEAATGKKCPGCFLPLPNFFLSEEKDDETGQNPDQINETLILIDKRFGIRARIRNFILNLLRR